MAGLEKTNHQLLARLAKLESAQPKPVEPQEKRGWISGKGIRSLRTKLGLSQADFAKLVGVSPITVYQWESKEGMLTFRGGTKAKVFAVGGIGAKEVKQRVAEMKQEPARRQKGKRGGNRRK